MEPVLQLLARVGPSDANVLITGEPGTGKEVVAKTLHAISLRANKPMVTVNAGGLAEGIFESELFGHVKGAFTDAKIDRVGRFELADGGTLFLDEIANVPMNLQSKMLRVLEIGAGIGSATAALLPVLPAERTRYLFTDVSAFFHPGARRKFAAFPFVEYGVLDALRDPLAQGFLPQSFDLIVAANVMHNAADPAAALARLRPLLADGGRLVLIEATRNTRAHAVSVGFIEGLSGVTDGDDGPFLPLPRWLDALDKAGFADAGSVRDSGEAGADFGLDTIVARAPPLDDAARRRHAATARENVTGAALRAHLAHARPASSPADIVVVEAMPLTRDGAVDRAALASARPVGRPALPSGATEQAVAAIWAQALGHDAVGVEDNFFDLGGDSLIAVRIVASVRERFGILGVVGAEAREDVALPHGIAGRELADGGRVDGARLERQPLVELQRELREVDRVQDRQVRPRRDGCIAHGIGQERPSAREQ